MTANGATAADRHDLLRAAENKAMDLFDEAVARGLVRAGATETGLNDEIRALAKELFDIDTYWHKRIVRSGPNTLCPYAENPPDRTIETEDIVFFDFGPVFDAWEADLGRTYVLGDDPTMLRIKADLEECWDLGKVHFEAHPDITGAQLFEFMAGLATERGWSYAIEHAGHLIGQFPHERIQGETRRNYIHPDNHDPMRAPDLEGRPRDWILEIQFVDHERRIGAFHEQLLTVA